MVTAAIIQLASQFGRYGYRKVTGLLHNAGWCVNHKRVERIWRQTLGDCAGERKVDYVTGLGGDNGFPQAGQAIICDCVDLHPGILITDKIRSDRDSRWRQ